MLRWLFDLLHRIFASSALFLVVRAATPTEEAIHRPDVHIVPLGAKPDYG